jgi:hypothetical protein
LNSVNDIFISTKHTVNTLDFPGTVIVSGDYPDTPADSERGNTIPPDKIADKRRIHQIIKPRFL